LYTGKIALKGVLRKDLFEHFLCLNVAMGILLSPKLCDDEEKVDYAEELLQYFVKQARHLYGAHYIVYNVHLLLHLAQTARKFGSLDSCCAFAFESYLHQLKRRVRSSQNPVVQLTRRLAELENFATVHKANRLKISVNRPNNAYILSDDSGCEVLSVSNDGKTYECRVYKNGRRLFKRPCDARMLGMFTVRRTNAHIQFLNQSKLKRRAIFNEREEHQSHIFLAILHDF